MDVDTKKLYICPGCGSETPVAQDWVGKTCMECFIAGVTAKALLEYQEATQATTTTKRIMYLLLISLLFIVFLFLTYAELETGCSKPDKLIQEVQMLPQKF